jgi:glycerol-3-phosphate dehydrogenase
MPVSNRLSTMEHARLAADTSEPFDLIIVGAGINGAGIARDAAMRGLKVLLLDKGDVGGGTSSWSTRLIHGGLRYLEHREIGLVRESLRERETLLRIAPHLVRPLPILIPIYKDSQRGRWTIRAGMLFYDALSAGKSLASHRMLSRAEALEQAPGLNPVGLLGAALYYDAQVEFAERLVLENALAAKEYGATILTYARVNRFIVEDEAVRGVEFTDLLSNQTHGVRGQVTINAAGPWVDQVVTGLGAQRMIGGTKGSHLVAASFAGASSMALYIEAKVDRRPFFIIPWNKAFLIGTTDIRFQGDLDQVEITTEEIDYLVSETNRIIPDANLSRDSILFTYSGVRPLAFKEDKDEQSITRRHFVHDHAPRLSRLISIVGGKLTTHRSLAQKAVDLVSRKLGRTTPPCGTDQVPLPGAMTADLSALTKVFKVEGALPEKVSERLLRIYGARAAGILKSIADDPALAETFDVAKSAIAAEVLFAFQHEMATTLTDCLLRRTMIGLGPSRSIADADQAAKIAQDHLGWSNDRARREVDEYRSYIKRFMSDKL